MTSQETQGLLLIGAGDLGTQIGLAYLDATQDGSQGADGLSPLVVAVRRHPENLPRDFHGVAGDIADGLPGAVDVALPGGPRHLVVCLTASGRTAEAYRSTFIDGVSRVLDGIAERGWAPERAVFVSSTGVCADEGEVDETIAAAPTSPTSEVLLAAEETFVSGLSTTTSAVVVRPSGLYGPGRHWFINQVRTGEVRNPERMTHRIHRDDAARAIVHLLTMPGQPDTLYLLTDDEPVSAGDVAAFIAQEVGALPVEAWTSRARASEIDSPRRLSNARLRSTGFEFTHPTYREGYRAVLRGDGGRHP